MKKNIFTLILMLIANVIYGQYVAVDPTAEGGFEESTSFGGNGWTVVNHTTNTWNLGSVPGPYAGSRCAYISNNGGSSYLYSNGNRTSHFYRDVVLPAGVTSISLSFRWKAYAESGYDRLLVYRAPTSVTPVAGVPSSTSTTLSGATKIFQQPTYSSAAPWTLATISIPSSLAGTTVRIIFTWQNDGSVIRNPPAAVDNVSVTYVVPCTTPPAITGTAKVCNGGGMTTLANAATGGTWSSSNAGVATVGASTGVVTGGSVGTARITYTVFGGCYIDKVVTVNARPTVAGVTPSSTAVCEGTPLTLTAGSISGTGTFMSYNWSGPDGFSTTTSTPSVEYIPPTTSSTGIYSLTVTYSGGGCTSNPASETAAITVEPSPVAVTGVTTLCEAATTTLSCATPSGTWSSAATAVAAVDLFSGEVTGVSGGAVAINYTGSNGCISSTIVSVNPLPVVTVTPPGPTTICLGATTSFSANSPNPTFALLSQNFEGGLADWTVTGTALPANEWQIVTPSTSADGTPGDGSNMVQAAAQGALTITTLTSPSFSTIGYGSAVLEFNQYLLSVGDNSIKVEYSTNGGSSWNVIADQTNNILGSGVWSAAAAEFSMPLPFGALGQADVMIRFYYDANAYYWFLDNVVVNGALPASTYSWSGAFGLSCTACADADITPGTTGANLYDVTVTSSAGCTTTNDVTVNVNPLPGTITGNLNICVGTTFSLGNSASGGMWASSNGNVTIDMMSGSMTGMNPGTTTISYTLPTGCMMTAVATVTPMPSPITGTPVVCEGVTGTLGHPVAGGVWMSANTSVATINSFGVVDGMMPGTSSITYTLPSGCIVSQDVSVNASPAAITGSAVVCKSSTTSLTSATSGGFWSSGAPTLATVDPSGTVTGVDEGYAVITYSLITGCQTIQVVSVNGLPDPIAGSLQVCAGSTTVLTNGTPGGIWSSNFMLVATIDGSGTMSGMSAGNSVISYVLASTGCGVAATATVNALPANIGGVMEVCVNDLTALVNATFGGTWTSSNTTTLTIDPTSGVAAGVNAGVATVTYALSNGCLTTVSVSVNALPGPIVGTTAVCVGQEITLFDFTPGGGWISGNNTIADVSSTGVVTGMGPGQVQISYVLGTGCEVSQIVTVDPLPGLITGIFEVCSGQVTLLGNPDAGGMWSSGNASIASVDASGLVTGGTPGIATIMYTLPTGCQRTQGVQVNMLPGAIAGPATVCEGQTVSWGNSSAGGIWISENSGIASVDGMGVITGVGAGMTNITYTLATGCERVRSIVVNPAPAAISGTAQVCPGMTTTLSSVSAGGAWTSSAPMTAGVNNLSGMVTGNAPGNVMITYTLPAGCMTTTAFVVNPLPPAITGILNVCVGATTLLSDAEAGGSWAVASTLNASVDMTTGVVTGNNAGTATVIYTLPTTCARSTTVLVNPLPAPIFGILNVCTGAATSLANSTPDGTWTSSATGIATVSSTGNVIGLTNGVTNIGYTLPTGCTSSASVVVNPRPADISGTTTVCEGQSISLSNSTPGGMWVSDNPSIASVDGAGMVTGNSDGSATIMYTLVTGCSKSAMIMVDPLPAPIVGNMNICQGSGAVLYSLTPGGTWFSNDGSVATVNTTTGVVFGNMPGFSVINYILPTGCGVSATAIVNDIPDVITGPATICAGSTTILNNATGGGTWSSSPTVAVIDASGMVTGIAAGTSRITYTLSNNCRRITVMTVNAQPGLIAGIPSVCPGATTILSNANASGIWTSDDDMVATVGASSGIVAGNASGVANITYALPNGCMRSMAVTVHPSVDAIAGTMEVCEGMTTSLSDATPGGAWASGNTSVAAIDAGTGVVTGISAGATMITYAMPTGCMVMSNVIVNALPENIMGSAAVCEGSVTDLNNTTGGGIWSSSDDATATVDAVGVVSGIMPGSASIMYTLPTGCMQVKDMMVNAMPAMNTVTGGGSYCAGGMGVSIGMDGSVPGNDYTLMLGSGIVMTMAGDGSVLDFGMKTNGGMYTVSATTSAGCMLVMTGSATITIDPLITPSVTISSDMGATLCSGTPATFTATGTDGGMTPGYIWSVGGTAVNTGSTFTYTSLNGDLVSVEFMSSEACATPADVSASMTILVTPALTPAVSIAGHPGNTVCEGTFVSFNASSANGGTAPAYTWIVGGSVVPGVNGPVYTYIPTNGQTVVCKLTSNYSCPASNDVSSNMVTMKVDKVFVPVVTIIADPGTTVQQGQSVTFNANATNAGATPGYQWQINGADIQNANSAVFTTGQLSDNDIVTCYVTGSGDCGKVSFNSVTMEVTESTGIIGTTMVKNELVLVPNPNNGDFSVSGTMNVAPDEKALIEVTNMLGQVVFRAQPKVVNGMMNENIHIGGNLANGMYLLNVTTGGERMVFHFVVKQ